MNQINQHPSQNGQNHDSNMNGLQLQQNNDSLFIAVDMTGSELPDLDDAEIMPIELTSTYWTPEAAGECKKVFFDSIKTRLMPAQREGEDPIVLPCAYFIEKVGNDYVSICNGSKRLVAAIENGLVRRGVPLIITYLGKMKNATNAFKSDSWSVKPLIPKQSLITASVNHEIKENANKADIIGFDDQKTDFVETAGTQIKADF
jgi:hypothetical protein